MRTMPGAARRAAVGLALAAACATAPDRVPAPPPPEAEATVVAAPALASVRCLLVAPFEDASDRPKLGELATSALVSSIDPEQTRVFPVDDLRRLFRGTSLELPPGGVSARLALDLADKVKADAVLYGSVEGSAQGASASLVVSLRLQVTASREVLFANAAPVKLARAEQVEVALRRALLLAARPLLLKMGAPGDRTCFDPELVRRARVMRATASVVASTAPAAEPGPPALDPAALAAAGVVAQLSASAAANPDPRAARQADLARRLERGERFVLDDVEFAGRTAVLEQEAGVEDLARAMSAAPRTSIRIEVFVDATSNPQKDASDSMAQAMTVVRRLVVLGVARERIGQIARGGQDPVAPNMTAKGRAQNRRVEVVATAGR
jgi:outer membrane protein OmpA-like peptidoglycan-associated protein